MEVYIFVVKLSILFDEMKFCKLLILFDMDMLFNGRIIFRKILLDSFKLLVWYIKFIRFIYKKNNRKI